jgi:hypothetical protein
MSVRCLCVAFLSCAAAARSAEDAASLLAKAATAFRANEPRQRDWNWQVTETRDLVDRSGRTVQKFPAVISESVLRPDGRRCNAIASWGDGRRPYLADASPDERCQAMNAVAPPFPPLGVLLSRKAKVVEESGSTITITAEVDKSRVKDPDFDIRCGASIRATVKLDKETFFPMLIEGEVAESGCDSVFSAVNHYEAITRGPMTSNFRKGSTFQVEWTLNRDKTGDPGKNFWLASAQHYSQPWNNDNRVLYYWGRQVPVLREGHRLIKDIRTTAQEFIVGSQVIFK